MKRNLLLALLILCAALSVVACSSEPSSTTSQTTAPPSATVATAATTTLPAAITTAEDFGTLSIENIEGLCVGNTKKIFAEFSDPNKKEDITYTFDGEDIKIEDGKVTALVADKTVTVTATTAHHSVTFTVTTVVNKGTLTIDQVFAWIDYPVSDFYPVFSIPEYKETLTYTYDTEGIYIDPQTNTVKALKAGIYKVTASSESFEVEFKVNAEAIDKTAKGANGKIKFSSKEFVGAANDRKAQWDAKGVDGKTTLFIGDSFFDTAFWSNFYTSAYPKKDALCLGISATTTYDWEDWINGWLGKTKPKSIVMHMGTNNVYDDGDGVSAAVSSLQRMFTLMHSKFPDVPIYWFGISQRSYDTGKISNVSAINKRMQSWCDARDYITYMDTPSELTNDMLKDSVHPKLEYYSVFINALAKTGIVIEDAEETDTSKIEDISLTTSQSINNGTSIKTITYKGETLAANYILEGKLDITKRTTNPHIQFGILNNGNDRILLWDHQSNGNFKLVIPYDTNSVPTEDIYTHTANSTLTINWKIVATDNDIYFFIDGELKLVYAAVNDLSGNPLKLGSEAVNCKFYDMTAITKSADSAEFDAALEEMTDIINTYGSKTSYEKIRV